MFQRIGIECLKMQWSKKDLAEKTGIKYNALLSKLNGNTDFTRTEMLKIQSVFPQKVSLEELFYVCESKTA